MATNYGITHCKRILSQLREKEEKLFEQTGYGFDIFQQEAVTERRYKGLLKQFEREKELGLQPSYRPSVHGE